jgi:hypothetical protein
MMSAEIERRLFASGATIVNVHTGQKDQLRTIEFYGREVVPKVRRGAGAGSKA